MAAERPTKVRELFNEILATPPRDKARFLADSCGDDQELRRAVEELLDQHTNTTGDLTNLLMAAAAGDAAAHDRVLSCLYDELKALAHRKMQGERPGHILQTTALVHEAYARLFGGHQIDWKNRRYFFGAAARTMKRILVEIARKQERDKRGKEKYAELVASRASGSVVGVSEALQSLDEVDPRKAEIVLLRYFGGLTVDQTAELMDLSPRTIDAEWHFARAWLHRELSRGLTTGHP